jgi:hypothetical protein
MEGAQELAELLSSRIRSGFADTDIYSRLPLTSRVQNSAFCFMGEKAFRQKHPKELAGVLMLDKMVEGYSASYFFENSTAVLFQIKYKNYINAREAMNSFIENNPDAKILPSQPSLQYFAVVETIEDQDLIISMGEWLYLMQSDKYSREAQNFFEFVLRGGK